MSSSPSSQRANATGSNADAVAQHQAGHHLIAGSARRARRRPRSSTTSGMRAQRGLDRPGREVLAVDPDPVRGAAGEVEVAVLVDVAEVAGPVPAEAGRLLGRLGVVVVALERTDARGVDDLADALVRVRRGGRARRAAPAASRCRPRRRPSPRPAPAERTGALLDVAVDRDAALGRAVRVDDVDAEAARRTPPRPGANPRCRTRPAAGCRRRRAARAVARR